MSLARKVSYLNKLRRVHRQYGGSWMRAAQRFYDLTGPRQFSPNEVFVLGLMDPALDVADLDRFISKQTLLDRQSAVNPRDHYRLTEDKVLFFRHCIANDLPTPKILGIWSSRNGYLNHPSIPFIPVVNDAQDWRALMESLDTPALVIKPIDGVHGESVMLLERDNEVFHTHDGADLDVNQLLARMRASHYSHWMVQQRLYAHPEIAAITGSKNLSTARVVTWVDAENCARVIFAWLRIIGGSDAFDNFNFGAAGNYVGTVDLETAKIRYVLDVRADGCGLQEVIRHPGSGKDMRGFAIPYGQQMFEIVQRAAGCFAPLRTIGWDLAITAHGVALVEGNVTWDPLPTREDLARIAALK